MPCNAVATARAQVSADTLTGLLTDEVVATLALDFLRRTYPDLLVQSQRTGASGVLFTLTGPLTTIAVSVRAGKAIVDVAGDRESGTARTPQLADQLATDLVDFLAKAAGLLLQQRLRAAIGQQVPISAEERVNGALFLTVEL